MATTNPLIRIGSEVRVVRQFPFTHERTGKIMWGPDYRGRVGVVVSINRNAGAKWQYKVVFEKMPEGVPDIPFRTQEVELV